MWFIDDRVIVVPFWFVLILTGAAPMLWLATRIRQRQRAWASRCRACGYDLRATPDRCPECGALAAGDAAPVT